MIIEIARLIITIAAALLAGKLIAKLKLPAILGLADRRNGIRPPRRWAVERAPDGIRWYEVTESFT